MVAMATAAGQICITEANCNKLNQINFKSDYWASAAAAPWPNVWPMAAAMLHAVTSSDVPIKHQ